MACDTRATAEDDLVESAALVAVTVYVPAEDGAVYKPALVMDPPDAAQVTEVLLEPDTEAVNCFCPPVERLAVLGESEIDT